MTIEELAREMKSKLPPAKDADISSMEKELGAKLPGDYRQFLVLTNGGHIGGRYWFKGPTPEGKPADAGVNHVGGFREEYYFSLADHRECYQGPEPRIPLELMWIMDDPFGNAICLGLRGKHRGRVYFWDHEREPEPDEWDGQVETAGNIRLLANSFTEFVAGLRPLES